MIFHSIKKIPDFNYSYITFVQEVRDGTLIYFDKNYLLKVLNTNSLEPRLEIKLDNSYSIHYIEKIIYLRKGDYSIFKLNENSCSLTPVFKSKIIEDYKASVGFLNHDYLVERQARYENYKCVDQIINVYRANDLELLYSNSGNLSIHNFDFEYVYFLTEFSIAKFDYSLNVEVWKYNFKKKSFGNRIIYENDIILVIEDGYSDENKSISLNCIDKFNGSSMWQIHNSHHFYNYDDRNRRLIGLGFNYNNMDRICSNFEIINIITGKREVQHELNLQIPAHLTYYADGYLYFSGYKSDNISPIFGAVDVETGEIAFTQTIETPHGEVYRGCYDRPVVVGKRLYIRDQNKTLHIYERE